MNVTRKPGIGSKIQLRWARFWMRYAGLSPAGRLATLLASIAAEPFYGRARLARLHQHGYISSKAQVHHSQLELGNYVFIDDQVLIYEDQAAYPGHRDKLNGKVTLNERVSLLRGTILQTGAGGFIEIGERTVVQPRCQLTAYAGSIHIGKQCQIAPNCGFYPYNHGFAADQPISQQNIITKGGIFIGEDVWLGFGVIVLDGVNIGKGAVVGAGSVVVADIPENAIAVGNPANVVRFREEKASNRKGP